MARVKWSIEDEQLLISLVRQGFTLERIHEKFEGKFLLKTIRDKLSQKRKGEDQSDNQEQKSEIRVTRSQDWTAEQQDTLVKAYYETPDDWKTVSAKVGRSIGACTGRLAQLRREHPSLDSLKFISWADSDTTDKDVLNTLSNIRQDGRGPWSKADESRLLALVKEGKTFLEMQLDYPRRSLDAIRNKAIRLQSSIKKEEEEEEEEGEEEEGEEEGGGEAASASASLSAKDEATSHESASDSTQNLVQESDFETDNSAGSVEMESESSPGRAGTEMQGSESDENSTASQGNKPSQTSDPSTGGDKSLQDSPVPQQMSSVEGPDTEQQHHDASLYDATPPTSPRSEYVIPFDTDDPEYFPLPELFDGVLPSLNPNDDDFPFPLPPLSPIQVPVDSEEPLNTAVGGDDGIPTWSPSLEGLEGEPTFAEFFDLDFGDDDSFNDIFRQDP